MKTEFTTAFIKDNCGCYSLSKLKEVYYRNNKHCFSDDENCVITIEEIISSNIPLRDKYWFLCKKVFTKEQNQFVAISVAEIVLPIYEGRYPDSLAPRKAIEAAKLYLAGHLSLDKLLDAKRAAAAAAVAAAYVNVYVAAAAAVAADAAAAAYAADAADAAYVADAAVAADAADAADADAADAAYTVKLQEFLENFINENKNK